MPRQRLDVAVVAAGRDDHVAVARLAVVGRVEGVPAVVPPLDPGVRLARDGLADGGVGASGAGSRTRSAPGCRASAARRSTRCAMSWHTPARWRQASAATVVDVGRPGAVLHLVGGPARTPRGRPRPGSGGLGADRADQRRRGPRAGRPARGSARYSVHRSATSRLGAASSQPRCGSAARRRGRSCTVDDAVTVIDSCGSSTSKAVTCGAEVVAVLVGPRRRGHLEPACARRSARASSCGVIRAWL